VLEDEKNAETENNNDGDKEEAKKENTDDGADDKKADDEKADDKKADDKNADDKNADDKNADDNNEQQEATPAPTEAADDDKKADDDTATPEPSQESTPTPPGPSADDNNTDDNNTDDSNQTLMELLDKITPDTIYLGVGQKIQDAYREVSKAVQKFEQLDHFIMGDFEKKLADIKGHYVRIYNKVQQKVKVIQSEVKSAKDNIQEDPPKYIPESPMQGGR